MAPCAGERTGAGSAAGTAVFWGSYMAVVLELAVVKLERVFWGERGWGRGGNGPDCAEVRKEGVLCWRLLGHFEE